MDAVNNIKEVWNAVTKSILKGVWTKLCPKFVESIEGFLDPIAEVTRSAVEIANSGDLEVHPADGSGFLDSYSGTHERRSFGSFRTRSCR
jgi:hypothetical protein